MPMEVGAVKMTLPPVASVQWRRVVPWNTGSPWHPGPPGALEGEVPAQSADFVGPVRLASGPFPAT
jgi:hypothetical protein